MIIGSILENKKLENRVAITPDVIKKYKSLGLEIHLSRDYALHLGIEDKEYEKEGVIFFANDDDVMLWTNSDMIYFQDMIDNILSFKKYKPNEKNYLLVGGRIDWYNPKILEKLDKQYFYNNINLNNKFTGVDICFVESKNFECCNHPLCGIDYVIHSKSTLLNNIDVIIRHKSENLVNLFIRRSFSEHLSSWINDSASRL